MSGLDKIKDRILEDAEKEAKKRVEAAEKEAGEIKSKAVREADRIAEDYSARSEQEARAVEERAMSSIDMDKRMRLLEAKQEMIGDILEEARRKISSLDSREYFALLLKVAGRNMKPEKGICYLSKKDLARLPEGFDKSISDAAKDVGGDLAVSREPRDIGPGIVLSYGGIEENLTFDAMFEAKKDDLTDIVSTILFS